MSIVYKYKKMATTYAKNKVHIYNWVANNPDRKREINKMVMRRSRDPWLKICYIFNRILLD